MFVCPIIPQDPLDRFALNFDWETRENLENVLNLILRYKIDWIAFFSGKIVTLTTLGSQASLYLIEISFLLPFFNTIASRDQVVFMLNVYFLVRLIPYFLLHSTSVVLL